MPRTLSDAIKNAAAGSFQRTAHLFRAVFTNSQNGQDEVFYLTDNFRDVEYDGHTFSAVGHLLGFEGVEESSDFQISTARVTLSAVDLALVSAVLQYRYIDRALEIWRVFFTLPGNIADVWDDSMTWDDYAVLAGSSEVLIDSPVKIFSGRMAEPAISEDPVAGNATVSLTASSLFADFDRRPGRHTNHTEQQAYFLGDRFFEAWGSPDQDLVWGRSA